jgi:D-glycero-D-manno-heptose 1,7-bisphosphate phosphatase
MGIAALKQRRAVFLDRDGVLNRAVVRDGRPHPPASVDELELLPGAVDALACLRRCGFLLLVVSNQPDVARGTQTRDRVERINHTLRACLPLDDFFVCYHDDAAGCGCRKPRPGLLRDAAARHGVDLTKSFAIGDRWRDVDAAAQAGVRCVFIDHGYRERPPASQPDAVVGSVLEAAHWIRGHSR